MTLLRSLLNTFQSADRPPVSTTKTIEDKDKLAGWIVKSYLENGSSTMESVLERLADLRFCSLMSRHVALAIFGPSGAGMIDRIKAISDSMGYKLALQKSGRLADTRTHANTATPVKYKGFGSTLNNPDARGHLFQINMLSFVEDKPIIGILESPERDTAYPTKGMREVGECGPWRLFELDRALSDDMTALIVKPDKGDVRVEFAYFESIYDRNIKIIYRLNTAR